MGAAMLAAYGSGWFPSLRECALKFVRRGVSYTPQPASAAAYAELFPVYRQVYRHTRS